MCTAITYKTNDHYFGRNLDLEYSYHETVTITPRKFPLSFRKQDTLQEHYAMIGMAYVVDNYPLYYDATNEHGLSMAGLRFPNYAEYKSETIGKDNIASFELIPWILAQCMDISDAKRLLERINLIDLAFSTELPPSPLHWMVSDSEQAIVIESVRDELKVHENPVGVLTNSPPFGYQMMHLSDYMNLSAYTAANHFSEKLKIEPYSYGMGAMGLPGDFSSASRFVRAAFVKLNSVSGLSESESVGQFFHILDSVGQPRGCTRLENGKNEITVYSSCCNTDRGIYYYKTYENSCISAVDMHRGDLNSAKLICCPLEKDQQIILQNAN